MAATAAHTASSTRPRGSAATGSWRPSRVAGQTPGKPDDVRRSARDGAPTTVMEQFGRTRSSFSRLVRAHIDLFKAEIGEIIDKVKFMGTLAGVALIVLLFVGNMLYVGGFLFLGE